MRTGHAPAHEDDAIATSPPTPARARQAAAAALSWTREHPPGGAWVTWVFTLDTDREGVGPRVGSDRLSPGTASGQSPLATLVARTSGVRTVGAGLVVTVPATYVAASSARDGAGRRLARPRIVPRSSTTWHGRGEPALAAVAQLGTDADPAVLVALRGGRDVPFDPSEPDAPVAFPAADPVPALLRRAVLGPAAVPGDGLPDPGAVLVRAWLSAVINASLAHGPRSPEVRRALASAPTATDVAAATVASVHAAVVEGRLEGMPPAHARWAGPELTVRILSGIHAGIPGLLATAGQQWPRLGAQLADTCAQLMPALQR